MSYIQLLLIVSVFGIICILIGYYWYQELKFKKLVENSFNFHVDDSINENQAVVLDATMSLPNSILQEDIYSQNLEAPSKINNEDTGYNVIDKFLVLDEKIFNYKIDTNYDYIVDIVFNTSIKIRALPDISMYTTMPFVFFVVNTDDNNWQPFINGQKYNVCGIKIVVSLINNHEVINELQLINIYSELKNFTDKYQGSIRQSNYSSQLLELQTYMRQLAELKFELKLFLILRDKIDYISIKNFFQHSGFILNDNKLEYYENKQLIYYIVAENNELLTSSNSYQLIQIVCVINTQPNIKDIFDNLFDIIENFINQFDARLLTSTKQIFSEKEYNTLNRFILNYQEKVKKNIDAMPQTLIARINQHNNLKKNN